MKVSRSYDHLPHLDKRTDLGLSVGQGTVVRDPLCDMSNKSVVGPVEVLRQDGATPGAVAPAYASCGFGAGYRLSLRSIEKPLDFVALNARGALGACS